MRPKGLVSEYKVSAGMKAAPRATIERMCRYQQALGQLERDGVQTVSSGQIGKLTATNGAQVRKDLSYFGEFGRRGLGYRVSDLRGSLREILGLSTPRHIAIIGAGNLGSALSGYPGFERRGFRVVGVFDSDPEKIGEERHALTVLPLSSLAELAAEIGVDIVVLAVPEAVAQIVADGVIAAGVRAILNFTPLHVEAPPGVVVRNVDMTSQLEFVSYFLALSEAQPEAASN